MAVCEPLLALSTTVNVPETWPMEVGVNVTLMTHEPPAGMDAGQVVAVKGPVAATLDTFSAVDWLLNKVVVFAPLVVPTT